MGDFKVIETQEQFDEAIKERIKRAEDAVKKDLEKKYADYDDIKKQLDDKTKELEKSAESLNDANDKIQKHDEEVKELNAKIKNYEDASVKARIAAEFKLPAHSTEFLQGEDEESIRKSAEKLKGMIGNNKPDPLDKLDPLDKTKLGQQKAYEKMAEQLFDNN